MTDDRDVMGRRFSRAQVLKAAGAGLALAAIPGAAGAEGGYGVSTGPGGPTSSMALPFFPQVPGTYTTETVPVIMNIAVTMEYLATTVVNAAVTRASALGLSPLALSTLQAALAEEVYHVQFLTSMGAKPATTTFTIPDPRMLTDAPTFFRNLEVLETICNAAYLTANRELAELGQPVLAKFAYQAGSVEAEHRVMARVAQAMLGVTSAVPPNNKAFETDLFLYLTDAAEVVAALGFIGGTGTALTFPGTTTALANAGAMGTAVIQKLPNLTSPSVTATSNLTGERGPLPPPATTAPGTGTSTPGTGTTTGMGTGTGTGTGSYSP